MRYQVRRLQTRDLPRVTEIYNATCLATESTQGTRPWSVVEMGDFLFNLRPSFMSYTCLDKDTVVGWAALTRHHVNDGLKHTAEMSLYVQKSFRRKGAGSALAHALLSGASIADLHCILAIVFKDKAEIVSFAKAKCGFSVAGCLPGAFPGSEKNYDILVLQKLIVP